MTHTRRHGANIERAHYVPQAYLQAWADEGDRVSLRRRDRRNASLAMIKDVAAERGLHGLGVAGRGREKLFGGIESSWPRLRVELENGGPLVANDRRDAAIFAALQYVRTGEHLAQAGFLVSITEAITERPLTRQAIQEFLTEKHLGFQPSDAEVDGAWTLAAYAINKGTYRPVTTSSGCASGSLSIMRHCVRKCPGRSRPAESRS